MSSCSHLLCPPCLVQYLSNQLVKRRHFTRPFPIPCPGSVKDGHCSSAISSFVIDRVTPLLALSDQIALTEIEAKTALGSQLIYCPHQSCSMLIERPTIPVRWDIIFSSYSSPCASQCPHCNNTVCVGCLAPNAHLGLTCEQYLALPSNQRASEDIALILLAQKKMWKQCPLCLFYVEKVDGCSHMVCRCGCRFCYTCGCNFYSGGPGTAHTGCKCD
jgi:E3 ubiquitin-protein ligase RNF144